MAPTRRRDPLLRRRRRTDDEGEEEGSQAGDVEDDSLTEGSVTTHDDVDADASEISEDESIKPEEVPTKFIPTAAPRAAQHEQTSLNGALDTKQTINGSTPTADVGKVKDVYLDAVEPKSNVEESAGKQKVNGAARESLADRSRRDHEAYLKERRDNPAFVPNRGGFFLHDNRNHGATNGFRAPGRGRGRGRAQFGGAGYARPAPEPATHQWSHDLHETVAQPVATPSSAVPALFRNANVATQAHPPRTFNTTIVLGNVPVVVYIPGMKERKSVQTIAKKQHTLLPNHRPPLRRDKPVRVSLPDASPRYIFPAVERSFIFIPRALRPNQQSFSRGRGRGSFHGSRRTSAYGSVYTPSVAMSRRSSFGRGFGGDDLRSPGGTMLPRASVSFPEMARPVVRLPPSVQTAPNADNSGAPVNGAIPIASVIMPPPPYIPTHEGMRSERHPNNLPMYHPSPRKTVSVSDIEGPGHFHFHPPPQQIEQPFHQQVPTQVNATAFTEEAPSFLPHSRHPSHPSQASATPLSQIPEGAIHAQPFQPFPMPPSGFVPNPYAPGAVFYPGPNGEFGGYNPATAPTFVPQASNIPFMVPTVPPPAAPAGVEANPGHMVAHESNGMVYYYDPSQLQSSAGFSYPMAPPGGVMGMGGMMTPPGGFYYSPTPGGVYYAPQ